MQKKYTQPQSYLQVGLPPFSDLESHVVNFHQGTVVTVRVLTLTRVLELNPRGQVAPQVLVTNCDATKQAEGEGGAAVAT